MATEFLDLKMINIFNNARTKLTLYYLVIIMAISIFFSLIIYRSATYELRRIEDLQRMRRPGQVFLIDPDIITETKSRIFLTLLTINAFILGVSGVSGYFLAGKTLDPISEMMEEQKDFVSNASHELRTPLAILKSQIEVALREPKLKLSDVRELLRSNLDDVNNMTKLSNYLLKLNRFQDKNTKLEFKKVDLSAIIMKVVGDKKIKLKLEKIYVNGHEESIEELITILLDNAIKYGGGKTITIKTTKPRTIEVIDKGLGISEEDKKHIFDRFYRGDKARKLDGYGLGLSIAKQIADLHRAAITVSSKPGKGSTFKVTFS